MTTRFTRVLLAAGLLALITLPAEGQRRRLAGDGPARGARAAGVERILMLRERLELTDQQVEQLQALRREGLTHRQEQAARLMAIRSDLAAGEITRAEARERMQEGQEARRQAQAAYRERVDAVLTEDQRGQLIRAARTAMRRNRGPAGIRGGRGMRGNRARRFRRRDLDPGFQD